EVTFSCEKKVTGEAQLCSGQLVCANGECDAIENGTSDGFGKAVSALAAVTAAAQDVAAMNDVNVRAFTGKPVECRMAIAGFNNCCKDSGWGQGIGLAHCDSEEKALGKAKEKLLTVYVGTYCSKKALG
ncbi:conjugal transfer protein TraN, partial [Escherichia coli]